MKTIPINIWDDYAEEPISAITIMAGDTVLEELKSSFAGGTGIYVEDTARNKAFVGGALKKLLRYIDTEKLTFDAIFTLSFHPYSRRPYLNVRHLTHKNRKRLLWHLKRSHLMYRNIPFEFYSES